MAPRVSGRVIANQLRGPKLVSLPVLQRHIYAGNARHVSCGAYHCESVLFFKLLIATGVVPVVMGVQDVCRVPVPVQVDGGRLSQN
jgi:hypothetical protein